MKKINKLIQNVLFLTIFICAGLGFVQGAQDTKQLNRCLCEAKAELKEGQSNQKSLACLVELKNNYFKNNKFSEFVEFLKKGPCPGNKFVDSLSGYYIAQSRYSQLKYLEDTKNWDEYFSKGNDYRDDIVEGALKTINETKIEDPLNIRSRLLLFQLHKDLQDNFAEGVLGDLMNSVTEYARGKGDIEVIREVAEKLAAYDEKSKSKELYKVYSHKLASSDMEYGTLKAVAQDFYKSGNIELAESVYNIYIEKISKTFEQSKFIQELKEIATEFTYRDNSGNDPFYAEEIFSKIESIGGKDAFDEETMYLRGFNLEKSKLYTQAKDVYVEFIKKFPASKYAQEVIYKIANIYVYVLRDIKTARTYFEQLANKDTLSPQGLGSLYQLGLLKQWESEIPAAKKYYNKLLEKIGNSDEDRLDALKSRLKEIEENKPIEYNLKAALDTALKSEYVNLDLGKLDLKANLYEPQKGSEVTIVSSAYIGATGCLQVELQYLWSGDLGSAQPSAQDSEVKTAYKAPGTEVINVVLVSPTGITSRSIDFIDVR